MAKLYFDENGGFLGSQLSTDVGSVVVPQTFECDDADWLSLYAPNDPFLRLVDGAVVVDTAAQTTAAINLLNNAVTAYIDATCKAHGFEYGMASVAKYVGYANPFRANAEALGAWSAAIWTWLLAEMQNVLAGTRALPSSLDEILTDPAMPVLTMPA